MTHILLTRVGQGKCSSYVRVNVTPWPREADGESCHGAHDTHSAAYYHPVADLAIGGQRGTRHVTTR